MTPAVRASRGTHRSHPPVRGRPTHAVDRSPHPRPPARPHLPPEAIARTLGGRIRLAFTGAAPLAPEVLDFFASCGIPVLDTYGMTETSALVTGNRPDDHRPGTVEDGTLTPTLKIKRQAVAHRYADVLDALYA